MADQQIKEQKCRLERGMHVNKCWHTEEQIKICEHTPEGKSLSRARIYRTCND